MSKQMDELKETLSTTEPLHEVSFWADPDYCDVVVFDLPPAWNVGLKEADGTTLTDAVLSINTAEYEMTKDAILQATSAIGLTRDYVAKTPGPLVAEHLNYWYSHMSGQFKLLASNEHGLALTKSGMSPYSNLHLLDTMLDSINGVFVADECHVDKKVHHDLRLTNFRIMASEEVVITHHSDAGKREWAVGLDFQNSLTNEAALQVRGYLHSWDGQSGVVSTHGVSTFSRKGNPSIDSALEWVAAVADNFLDTYHHEMVAIESLSKMSIAGEANQVMQDIFEKYKVPRDAREQVLAEFVDAEDLTMYGAMSAVMSASNKPGLSPAVVRKLMEIAGDIPASASNRCDSCHRLPVA